MLRVQHLVLDIIKQLNPIVTIRRRKDRSLEDQLRRAITSVALNLAEGLASRDGNKRHRYVTALGSLDEARLAFDVAIAFDYVPALDPVLAKQLLDATYMLVRLAKRERLQVRRHRVRPTRLPSSDASPQAVSRVPWTAARGS